MRKKSQKHTEPPINPLRRLVRRLSPDFDMEAFEVALAVVKAQEGDGQTAWLNIHAPPSSGKTLILDSFPAQPLPDAGQIINGGILIIDSLTPRTLASGLANMQTPGLLEKIKACSLLIKDLSPLASSGESRAVFSQLRRVFDGEFSQTYGSGKTVRWKGRITVLCASVNHLSTLDAELGARLLSISLKPIEFSPLLAERHADLRPTVERVLAHTPQPHVTREMYSIALPLARALAVARAVIVRDYRERAYHELPTEELPHRLTTEFAALCAGLCALRQCSPDETRETLTRVAVESIPPFRRAVLSVLARNLPGLPQLDFIERVADQPRWVISERSVRYTIDDLVVLRLLDDRRMLPTGLGPPVAFVEPGTRWHEIACLTDWLKAH